MPFIADIYRLSLPTGAFCLLLLISGCSFVPKLQVRGTLVPQPNEQVDIAAIEEGGPCDLNGRRQIACSLSDQSIERLTLTVPLDDRESRVDLGVIEFNDDGTANPVQVSQVFTLLEEVVERGRSRYKGQTLIVVFVHGWHHGPQVCDGNLACFRRALARIQAHRDGPVVGVYLAWRGESHRGHNLLTIFDRKMVAQRIGRRDGLEVLLKIDDFSKQHQKNVSLVTVGHSLGGTILFTALQNKMLTEVGEEIAVRPIVEPHGEERRYDASAVRRGFGDLVVLVNPAIEAWEYRHFHLDTRDRRGRPELVVIASKADMAMGAGFTASRFLRIWKPHHWFRGWSNFRGLGRYKQHVTHTLAFDGDVLPLPETPPTCGCRYPVEDYVGVARSGFRLDRIDPEAPAREFLVIETDETVVNGHNDIYNPRLAEFLTAVVLGDVEFGSPEALAMVCSFEPTRGSERRTGDPCTDARPPASRMNP